MTNEPQTYYVLVTLNDVTGEESDALVEQLQEFADTLDSDQPTVQHLTPETLPDRYEERKVEPELLQAIYVPEKPATDDEGAVDAHLVCPHCGEDEDVVEVDSAIRWNTLSEGDDTYAHFYTGDNYDFEGDGFHCPSCMKDLLTPEQFLDPKFTVDYD